MSVQASCPSCGRSYRVRDEFAGKTVTCKQCGAAFRVPRRRPSPARRSPDVGWSDGGFATSGTSPSPRRRRRRSSLSKSQVVTVLRFAAIGVLVAGGLCLAVNWGRQFVAGFRAGWEAARRRNQTQAEPRAERPVVLSNLNRQPIRWDVTVDPPARTEETPSRSEGRVLVETAGTGGVFVVQRRPRFAALLVKGSGGSLQLELFDLLTGQSLSGVVTQPGWEAFLDVSPDRQWVLGQHKGPPVALVAVPMGGEAEPLQLAWSGDARLLPKDRLVLVKFGDKSSVAVELWSLKGERVAAWQVPHIPVPVTATPLDRYGWDVSPGGRYLAYSRLGQVRVVDLNTGQLVGQLDSRLGGSFQCNCLAFSHDGRRLAAFYEEYTVAGRGCVLCWDVGTGRLQGAYLLPETSAGMRSSRRVHLFWSPDDTKWLCFERLVVDARSGRVLADVVCGELSRRPLLGWVDNGTFAAFVRSGGGDALARIDPGWSRVERAVRALDQGEPAWVRPDQPVAVSVEVGSLRFGTETKKQTEQVLRQAAVRCLQRVGLNVSSRSSLVFRVRYSEKKGSLLTFTEHRRLGDDGKAATKVVRGTDTELELAWVVDGKVVWSERLEYEQDFTLLRGEVTERAVRDEALEETVFRFESQFVPYFVPKDQSVAYLPTVLNVEVEEEEESGPRLVVDDKAPLTESQLYKWAGKGAASFSWPPPFVKVRAAPVRPEVVSGHPPLTQPDWSAARTVAPPKKLPAWQSVAEEGEPSRQLAGTRPVKDSEWSHVSPRNVQFSPPSASRAAAVTTLPHWNDNRSSLLSFDLLHCRRLAEAKINDWAWLLAVSPDGKRAAVRLSFGSEKPLPLSCQSRVDVYSLDNGQHWVGWQPYADQPTADRVTVAAAFVDNDRLATLNPKGRLVVWKLPECRAEVVFETGGRPPLVLSRSRRYVGVVVGSTFRFVDWKEGRFVGQLEKPRLYGDPSEVLVTGAAVSPDGARLAAYVQTPGDQVVCWDLKTGQCQWVLPLTAQPTTDSLSRKSDDSGRPLLWTTDGWLVAGLLLIDPNGPKLLWRVQPDGATLLPVSPDGQLWWLRTDSLVSLIPPRSALAAAAKRAAPPGTPVLGPGDSVRLKLELEDPPAWRGEFDARVAAYLGWALARKGIQCSADADVTLVVRGRTHPGEGKLELTQPNGRGPTYHVREMVLELELAFVDKEGRTLWSRKWSEKTSPWTTLEMKTDANEEISTRSLETALRTRLWELSAFGFHRVELPPFLFENDSGRAVTTVRVDRGETWVSTGAAPADVLAGVPEVSPSDVLTPFARAVLSLDFSPTASHLLALCGQTVDGPPLRVWDLEKREVYREFRVSDLLTLVRFSPDGHTLAAGTGAGRVLLFRLNEPRRRPRSFPSEVRTSVTSLLWTPDGQSVLTGYGTGVFGFWNVQGKAEGKGVTKFARDIAQLALTPDQRRVAVFCRDGTVRLVDLQTKDWRDLASGVERAVFSADCTLAALTRQFKSRVDLLSLEDGATIDVLAMGLRPTALAFSPDGKQLAIGDLQGNVSLWDLKTGEPRLKLKGLKPKNRQYQPVREIAFSADGKRVAICYRDDVLVCVWTLPQEQ